MTSAEAKALVIYEGYSGEENAAYVLVHSGEEPSRERMQRLLASLKIVFDDLQRQDIIDRKLSAALWVLGNTIMDDWKTSQHNGGKWSDEFGDDVIGLFSIVESIFLDERVASGTEL